MRCEYAHGCDQRAMWMLSVPSREAYSCAIHLSLVVAATAMAWGEFRFELTAVDAIGSLAPREKQS